MISSVIPKRAIDWQPIRDAFIQRPERPTIDELATEFGISRSTLSNASSDEGWPVLRAQFMDAQLEKAGASEILMKAIRGAKANVDRGATFGLMALDGLCDILSHPKMAAYSPSTRAEVTNTCTFAFVNIARGLRELGVVGISKTLDEAGKERNGQWDPKLLQQINVTVQNLTGKAESAAAVDVPTATPPAEN